MFTYYSLVKQIIYHNMVFWYFFPLIGFFHSGPDTFLMVVVAKRAPGFELKSPGPRVWGGPFIHSSIHPSILWSSSTGWTRAGPHCWGKWNWPTLAWGESWEEVQSWILGIIKGKNPKINLWERFMWLSVDLLASRKIREGRTNINPLFLLGRKKENRVHIERELLLSRKVASSLFWLHLPMNKKCSLVCTSIYVYVFIYQLHTGIPVLIYTV